MLSCSFGDGKTTLIQRQWDEFELHHSISTTRAPRVCETDGKDYHFLSVEEFLRRGSRIFAEWANVHGNYYAAGPRARKTLKAGQDVLFDIDVQGAAQRTFAPACNTSSPAAVPERTGTPACAGAARTTRRASPAACPLTPPPKSARPTGSMHGSSTTIWTSL